MCMCTIITTLSKSLLKKIQNKLTIRIIDNEQNTVKEKNKAI